MQLDEYSQREEQRLEALRSYTILDTHPEKTFDDLTAIAAEVCGTPIALVSLVDEQRQWFKSRVGLDAPETPRDVAFCDHAIRGSDAMIVEDASKDPRFAQNPLVTSAPDIRFYAGAPLIDSGGFALGTLCVIDRRPRSLSERQLDTLNRLSRQVIQLFELRRVSAKLADSLERVQAVSALVPACSHCSAVRDADEGWRRIEHYFRDLTGVQFTHGVCPACMVVHYSQHLDELQPN